MIPLHFELTGNLVEKWSRFKAANFALNAVLDAGMVARKATELGLKLRSMTIPAAANFALNAVLDAGMVARKATELGLKLRSMTIPAGLLNVEELGEHGRLIFEYNNILRWLVLSSDNKSGDSNLSKIVLASSRLGQEELFADFVKMAHFEHKFRQSCVYLVKNKVAECDRLKSRINVLFDQVIQVLSNNLFESQTWNERLKNWMTTIKDCISGLNGEDVETPQVLQHLAEKIAEVAEMHDSEQKILKQYLSLVLNDLQKFRNVCLMDSEFISRLDEQRDACFVWDLFQSWIPALENLLKTDAVAVKFIFLKLSFSIENILKTILKPFPEQSKVLSKFYHRKLELQLRKIIQTIPRSIFIQMDGLQPLFSTNKVVQIEKLNLKQFADLGRRRLLAQKTYEIAKLSLGISSMCLSKLGPIEIEPKELLFDGLRQELRLKQLAQKTYEIAKLSLGISSMCLSKLGPIEIEPKELLFDGLRQELRLKLATFLAEELAAGNVLKTLALQTTKIHTFRNAFLFICEHIGFNGVALWQSELESVFNAAFQAEKENLKSKAPKNAPNLKNPKPKPIVGQVIHDLVKQTNPRTTVYFCMTDEWYSADLRKLEFSSDFFTVIEKWLPAIANVGLKRLISFSIHSHKKTALQELTSSAAIFEPFPEMNWKSISATLDSAGFIVFAKKMIEIASKIGQLTIVDACLSKTVQESLHARIEDVVCSVKNLLNSLAIDKKNGLKLESKPFEQSPEFSPEFVSMIERLDLYGKLAKRKLNVPNHVGFAIFGVLIHYLSTVTTSKKIEFSDNFVITTGLLTLAKLLNSMEKVEILVKLFISDANILANLKCLPSVKCVLGIQNIPEALKK
uniref:Uncharacterized protein n=1 Tax=Panagrolaimus sp. JU765 TaxID=591449 RepID=A0AC34R4K9_9BILA